MAEEGAAGVWKALRSLLPYLWPSGAPSLRLRVLLALAALVAAKVASVYIPVFYGRAVDVLSPAASGTVALGDAALADGTTR